MKRRLFLAAAAAGAAAATTGFAAVPPAGRPGIALVLGSGGCRGHGHIGVLRVLEQNGLKPDLVVGASVGALIGAFYAAGVSTEAIERYGEGISSNTFRSWVFPKLGVFGGGRIRRFVNQRLGQRTIASLPTAYAAVATDLRSGRLVVLDRGDLGTAVQASSSAPGLLEPVKLDGRLLVDGSLAGPVPVDVARMLGARHVVAVDVSFPPEQANLEDPYDALYQGFSILTRRLALEERERADLLIAPVLPAHEDMSQATLRSLVASGERAATEALPRLRALYRRAG